MNKLNITYDPLFIIRLKDFISNTKPRKQIKVFLNLPIVYSIKLHGNPKLGKGKSKNQICDCFHLWKCFSYN